MAKNNAVLAAHEAMLEKRYRRKLFVAMQMSFGVAAITANDVFHMGPSRAGVFKTKYDENYQTIMRLLVEDQSDPDLEYSRSCVDDRLKAIFGEAFQPWDARYEG
jgi:hypothetical protein